MWEKPIGVKLQVLDQAQDKRHRGVLNFYVVVVNDKIKNGGGRNKFGLLRFGIV